MSDHPGLPAGVVILPGTAVHRAWEFFEKFEALHHEMSICNPLSDDDLDAVVTALEPADGDRVLDVGCGHGELLLRIAELRVIDGTGVDLSPWAVGRAAQRAAERSLRGRVAWWLGDGAEVPDEERWDIVSCLGADWIWDGFAGTVAALARRTVAGGRIAVGVTQLRDGADPEGLRDDWGEVMGRDAQRRIVEAHGIDVNAEFVTTVASWDAYQARVAASATSWAALHPGAEAKAYLAEQRRWADRHRHDVDAVGWAVWVGRKV